MNTQRMSALDWANVVRSRRAELKRRWSTAPKQAALDEFAAVITDPPEWLRDMRLDRLMDMLPRIGPAFRARITRRLVVRPYITIFELSAREVGKLTVWARGGGGVP